MGLELQQPQEKALKGLSDGGKVVFECPVCCKQLCEAWVTLPTLPQSYSFRAECCYCPGKYLSEEKVIKGGGLQLAGISEPILGDPTNARLLTSIADTEFVTDTDVIIRLDDRTRKG